MKNMFLDDDLGINTNNDYNYEKSKNVFNRKRNERC